MICLLTDFGLQDGYVGVMKGVIQALAPGKTILDLSHHIPPQDVSAAAFILWNSYRYFPENTIFVCVVDPGVGTGRKILVVKSEKYVFIVPDNGLINLIMADLEIELVVEVSNQAYMLEEVSHTFHGRDIFSPVAAHIANGVVLSDLGPKMELPAFSTPFFKVAHSDLHQAIMGKIIYIDHFGNLITNIKMENFVHGQVYVPTLGTSYNMKSTYGEAGFNEVLGLKGSHGLLEIAINGGNASATLNIGKGALIELRFSK